MAPSGRPRGSCPRALPRGAACALILLLLPGAAGQCDTVLDLALQGTATASSGNAALAIDGNSGTRWESAFSDPQSIAIDLGEPHVLCQVSLDWEAAHASSYRIETSDDGVSWVTAATTGATGAGVVTTTISDVTAQYVRMFGTERGTGFGYSLWTFAVYGHARPPSPPAWRPRPEPCIVY